MRSELGNGGLAKNNLKYDKVTNEKGEKGLEIPCPPSTFSTSIKFQFHILKKGLEDSSFLFSLKLIVLKESNGMGMTDYTSTDWLGQRVEKSSVRFPSFRIFGYASITPPV